MRLGLISDIHGNREGFEAVLAALGRAGVDQLAILGDIVGYGADPAFCVERAAGLMEAGALAVLGNHDAAISGSDEDMNRTAREAIRWTREQLSPAHRDVLDQLPPSAGLDDVLLVHASACHPTDWAYITDTRSAERSIRATSARITLVGHVHKPHLWRLTSAGIATGHVPHSGIEIPLAQSQHWLGVIGSAGQPRDGSPAAAYAVLDCKKRTLTFGRVDYDHFSAARKVREAGLPLALAERLVRGQ